nr:MAG TPA: major tail protein [Caudoviricetes sp.]
MPKNVYNNVEGHRILDNGTVCEDVTSVTLPNISHPTTTVSAAGMAADVDMPNTAKVEAMELSVAHNNGTNCAALGNPGKHAIEVRVVRQRYGVADGELDHESVKFRVTGIHKSTEKGNIETNNPYGSTDKFSVTRYEEIVDGKQTVLVDAMAGILKFNGVSYSDPVENLLN